MSIVQRRLGVLGASSLIGIFAGSVYADDGIGFDAELPELEKLDLPTITKSLKLPKWNPGKFEEYDKDVKEVLDIQNFTGARFTALCHVHPGLPQAETYEDYQMQMKPKDKEVVAVGTVNLGAPKLPQYEIRAISVLGKKGQNVLRGGMSSQSFSGGWNAKPKKGVETRVQFVVVPENPAYNNRSLEVDYQGTDFTATAALNSQFWQVSYLQNITRKFAVGSSMVRQYPKTIMIGALRYKNIVDNKGEVFCMSYSEQGVVATSYARKLSQEMTLATEMQVNLQNHDSRMHTGVLIRRPMFQFQGVIDSTGRISSIYEQDLSGIQKVRFSATMQHGSPKQATFGIGMEWNM